MKEGMLHVLSCAGPDQLSLQVLGYLAANNANRILRISCQDKSREYASSVLCSIDNFDAWTR